MVRAVASPIIVFASRWIDDVVPADESISFLVDRLESMNSATATEAIAEDLRLANRFACRAGLLTFSDKSGNSEDPRLASLSELESWVEQVPDRAVITRKRLIAGTGLYLDQLAEQDIEQHREFVRHNFETLLRLVEVRRQDALCVVEGMVDREDIWMESHDVAIALCRQSRRTGDARFVNAACKLLDWAYPAHRRLKGGKRLTRYLLALAEREYSLKGILP